MQKIDHSTIDASSADIKAIILDWIVTKYPSIDPATITVDTREVLTVGITIDVKTHETTIAIPAH